MTVNTEFQWICHPKAEALILRFIDECCQANAFIESLRQDLLKHTSTRLFDWVDHVIVGNSPAADIALEEMGFKAHYATPLYRLFHHPGAQLPRIAVYDHEQSGAGIAVLVDSIADFLQVRGLRGWIEGSPFSPYRRCSVKTENNITLWVVERRGIETIEPIYFEDGYLARYWQAVEKWKTRPRLLENEDEEMYQAIQLAQEIVSLVGEDLAACLILEAEREYWQSRNTAGQLQKNRQDRLGMGWANHDHHTFRSSRKHFPLLVRLFEILGFHCRERFYAGEEAGWGAQVMENPRARLVLFLDVDLAPEELAVDFSHHPMPDLPHLGTIGLWCALHGDSILKSGMHHLEAQFMFDELTRDLNALKVGVMEPFSNFPFLKQAFTEGEIWPVEHKRIQALLQAGKISEDQGHKFLSYGAVGSHMENLQRREGYKGFNQKNVSLIIKKTDPRSL